MSYRAKGEGAASTVGPVSITGTVNGHLRPHPAFLAEPATAQPHHHAQQGALGTRRTLCAHTDAHVAAGAVVVACAPCMQLSCLHHPCLNHACLNIMLESFMLESQTLVLGDSGMSTRSLIWRMHYLVCSWAEAQWVAESACTPRCMPSGGALHAHNGRTNFRPVSWASPPNEMPEQVRVPRREVAWCMHDAATVRPERSCGLGPRWGGAPVA